MPRELHTILVDPGEILTVRRLDDGYIEYSLTKSGFNHPETGDQVLGGVVHNPENDDRAGARRVLTALPTNMRDRLNTEIRERERVR